MKLTALIASLALVGFVAQANQPGDKAAHADAKAAPAAPATTEAPVHHAKKAMKGGKKAAHAEAKAAPAAPATTEAPATEVKK